MIISHYVDMAHSKASLIRRPYDREALASVKSWWIKKATLNNLGGGGRLFGVKEKVSTPPERTFRIQGHAQTLSCNFPLNARRSFFKHTTVTSGVTL